MSSPPQPTDGDPSKQSNDDCGSADAVEENRHRIATPSRLPSHSPLLSTPRHKAFTACARPAFLSRRFAAIWPPLTRKMVARLSRRLPYVRLPRRVQGQFASNAVAFKRRGGDERRLRLVFFMVRLLPRAAGRHGRGKHDARPRPARRLVGEGRGEGRARGARLHLGGANAPLRPWGAKRRPGGPSTLRHDRSSIG